MQSNMCKKSSFRCRGSRKDLSDFCRVTLATVSCHAVYHDVLAMPLAAVLCHFDIASSLLEAGKAGPGQKREKGQDHYSRYPEVMFLVTFHLTL
jgi:hypothetical protein